MEKHVTMTQDEHTRDGKGDFKIPLEYKKGGASGIEGSLYEVRLLTLLLLRATERGFSFRLATNMQDSGKFDDVVLHFWDKDHDTYKSFHIQTKHRSNQSEQITKKQLITDEDNDFSLVKYFYSFLDLKESGLIDQNSQVIVYTNIDFDEITKSYAENVTGEIGDLLYMDLLLNIEYGKEKDYTKKYDTFYRFKENIIQELSPKIQNYKPYRIATKLVEFIINGKIISMKSKDFNEFNSILCENIFNINNKNILLGFQENFIVNSSDLLSESKRFREILIKEIEKEKKSFNLKRTIERALDDSKNPNGTFERYFKNKFENKDSYCSSLEDLNEYMKYKKLGVRRDVKVTVEKGIVWPPVPEEEIREFLNQYLVFAVNQCNEKKLEDILKKKLENFNIFAPDYLQTKILQWYKEKLENNTGRILSNRDGKQFIDEICFKIQSYIFCEKLSRYNVQFKSSILQSVNNLICQQNKMFLFTVAYKSILGVVKIWQALNMEKSKYLFFTFENFVEKFERIVAVVENSSFKGIVVHCHPKEVNKAFEVYSNKKDSSFDTSYIVVSEEEGGLTRNTAVEWEMIKDIFKYEDLTNESGKMILEKKVKLQGSEVKIGELLDWEAAGGSADDILANLIVNREIAIGNNLNHSDIQKKPYFINPFINTKIEIHKKIFEDKNISDVFAISGLCEHESLKFKNIYFCKNIGDLENGDFDFEHDGVFILKEDADEIQFGDICERRSDSENIHWFKHNYWEYLWEKSQGSIRSIMAYRKESPSGGCSVPEMLESCVRSKVILLSASPGMGKSTLLSDIALRVKRANPSMWVIVVNLNEYSERLFEEIETSASPHDDIWALNLLHSMLRDGGFWNDDRLDKNIFDIALKMKGNIHLFFDGFDEIVADYEHTVSDLICNLSKSNITKIWITTRPHARDNLEIKLNKFAFTLIPFSAEDQERFLAEYWKNKLDANERFNESQYLDKKLAVYSNAVLKLISESVKPGNRDLTGVPLILKMLGEYFQSSSTRNGDWEGCLEFVTSVHNDILPKLPPKVALVQIYDDFIKKKIHLWGKEKLGFDLTKQGVRALLQSKLDEIYGKHKVFALHSLLNSTNFTKLYPIDEFKNFLKGLADEKMETIGIIENVTKGEPRFVHKTFAEFLGAVYIYEQLTGSESKFFSLAEEIGIFSEPNFETVRLFLNGLLVDASSFTQIPILEEIPRHLLQDGKETVFHIASREGNTRILVYLLGRINTSESLEKILHHRDVGGETLLDLTVVNRQLDVIEWLVGERKLDLNMKDAILKSAVQYGSSKLVQYLLQNGADVLLRERLKNSIESDTIMTVADLQKKCSSHLLQKAIIFSSYETVNYLVESGADVHERSEKGFTPLHLALNILSNRIFDSLVQKSSKVDRKGNTLVRSLSIISLHMTRDEFLKAVGDILRIVQFLIQKMQDLNIQDDNGLTVLHMTINICNLKRSGKIQYDSYHQMIYPQSVVGKWVLELVKELVCKGANVNIFTKSDKTPLHFAARHCQLEIVECLIANHADVNVQDSAGRTPLLTIFPPVVFIPQHGYVEVKDFSFYKEDLHTSNNTVIESLISAVVRCLLQNKADPNIYDVNRYSPLILAIYSDNFDAIKCLLEYGAKMEVVGHFKESCALHVALRHRNKKIIDLLIKKGADINKVGEWDLTPLQLVIEMELELPMIKYLVENGADINLQNTAGSTALHTLVATCGVGQAFYGVDIHNLNVSDFPLNTVFYASSKYYVLEDNGLVEYRLSSLHKRNNQRILEILRYMIKKGAKVNLKNSHGTPLHVAIPWCDLEIIKYLVRKGVDKDIKNQDGLTPLHVAIECRRRDIFEYLVLNDVNINTQDCYGSSLLQYAILKWKSLEVIELLINYRKDMDINVQDRRGITPIHQAVLSNCGDIVRYLALNGGICSTSDHNGNTPLHTAVARNRTEIVTFLTGYEYIINTTNKHGLTPLHVAIWKGNFKVIQNLIERSANINIKESKGSTILHMAAKWCKVEIVQYILSKCKEIINKRNNTGHTALHNAVIKGKIDVVTCLFDSGADVNIPDNCDSTPLHTAVNLRRNNIIEYLSDKCLNINIKNTAGLTSLHKAIKNVMFDAVHCLLKNGANVYIEDKNALNPLRYAIKRYKLIIHEKSDQTFFSIREVLNEKLQIVQCLTGYCRDTETLSTLLRVAVETKLVKCVLVGQTNEKMLEKSKIIRYLTNYYESQVVECLVKSGATVNYLYEDGSTLLHKAIELKRNEIVSLLVSKCASLLNVRDQKGLTPLHKAVIQNDFEAISCLVENKSNINIQDENGWTPLHFAVLHCELTTIRYFIGRCANLNIRNNEEETPLLLAIKRGKLEVAQCLIQHLKLTERVQVETMNTKYILFGDHV